MDRYKIVFFIILFLLVGVGFTYAKVMKDDFSLLTKVIYIDPGHGGRDQGTSYKTIKEKDLNLLIALKLRDKLLEEGAIVFMTREEDIDLSSRYDKNKKRGDLYRRIKLIEDSKADLYLSIHINWFDNPKYHGIDILYNDINAENKLLAESLYNSLKDNLDVRGMKTIDDYLYRNTRTLGLLIECGFLSNSNDRYKLQTSEYQEKLADEITKAVVNYYK